MPVTMYLCKSNMYDMIVYRHTNSVELRKDNTILFDTGEASGWLYGKPTIGIIDLDSMEMELINLN
jgi:predicted phosphodiesterase